MSNKQQNGRILSASNTDSAVYRGAGDPRLRNASFSGDPHDVVCRDFIWGICNKGAQCKYRHELSFELMKSILKFCHDYQNKSGCTRPGCTYLHVSNEEENLFLTTRQIPRILQERYVAMSANSSSSTYFNEIITQRPPPPPPIVPVVAAPPPPPPAPLPVLLVPPPPPPPTVSAAPVQNTSPIFTTAPPVKATLPLQSTGQPNVELPVFDASKPPPSLPNVTIAPKIAVKRLADSSTEAGPSKILKEDVSKLENSPCENCVQRELRVHTYQKVEEKIECETEIKTYKFQKNLEMYENGRMMLKSAVSPDLFRILDDYIQSPAQQSSSQVSDVSSQFNQMSSIVVGTSSSSTLQRQFLSNLMELTQNLVDVSPRPSVCENGTEVTTQSFLEMIRNVTSKPDIRGEESGLNNIDSEKNSSPSLTSGYSNNSNVPLRPLSAAASTSDASPASSGTAKSVAPPNGVIPHTHANTQLYTQSSPLTHAQSSPLTNARSSPLTNAQSTPFINAQSLPVTNAQSLPVINAQSSPLTNAQSSPLTNGQSLPVTNAQSSPLTNAQSSPVTNAQSSPVINAQSSPVTNAQSSPLTNAQSSPLTNGQSSPLTNAQRLPLTNAQSSPFTNARRSPLTNAQNSAPSQTVQRSTHQQPGTNCQAATNQNVPYANSLAHLQLRSHVPQQQHVPQIQPTQQQQPMPQPPHRMHLLNGTHPQQGMQQLRGAHAQNITSAAVPLSAYMPFQASVPPLKRPQYPQYPPALNRPSIASPQVRTGAPQLSVPMPATTVGPFLNGCLKNSPLPHYYAGYP